LSGETSNLLRESLCATSVKTSIGSNSIRRKFTRGVTFTSDELPPQMDSPNHSRVASQKNVHQHPRDTLKEFRQAAK
jgi:hypothetical protein